MGRLPRAKLLVFHGEPERCTGSVQCLPRVQGCREGSSALNGQQCVKVSDDSECTVAGAWVGVALFCCWCLSHYAAGHRSRALIAFACSLGRAAWISLAVFGSVCVCVCVCCFWAEWLGWTS